MPHFRSGAGGVPIISIVYRDAQLYVRFGEPPEPSVFTALMGIPSTLVEWLEGAADALWNDNRRCVAFVLLYNPIAGSWSITLSKQTCLSTHSHPAALEPDERDPAGYLAGTFQAFDPDRGMDSFANLVPPYSGIHILYNPPSGNRYLICRCEGLDDKLCKRPDATFIVDDRADLLEKARGRIQLA